MLIKFMNVNGFYYTLGLCCALGIIGKLYEWNIYRRLIREAENAGKSEHIMIKQLKLKIKSCYKLNLKVQNTRAFAEAYLCKCRFSGVKLGSMKNWGVACMLLCTAIGMVAVLMGISEKMSLNTIIFHAGTTMFAILLLQFTDEILSGVEKRKEILFILEDYLDNFLINRIENKEKDKLSEFQVESISRKIIQNDIYKEEKDIKEENKTPLNQAAELARRQEEMEKQTAVVTQQEFEEESEKRASKQERLIAEMIREFLA